MRHLKQLCAVCVLALVLALPALAGEMTTGVAAPAPPGHSNVTAQGEMTTGFAGANSTDGSATATDPATEILLNLLQSLLSLF